MQTLLSLQIVSVSLDGGCIVLNLSRQSIPRFIVSIPACHLAIKNMIFRVLTITWRFFCKCFQ